MLTLMGSDAPPPELLQSEPQAAGLQAGGPEGVITTVPAASLKVTVPWSVRVQLLADRVRV